jgi:hypothetical protein
MKQTLRRGLGLALATSLWVALTVAVVLAEPLHGRPRLAHPARPSSLSRGAAQEPPPDQTLWGRVSARTTSLFHPHDAQLAREAVKKAAETLGASAWSRAGHLGKGVKVAILDSGFKGYKKALGKALPPVVKARSFRKDGNLEAKESQHGILCGEVLHHLAPQAELLFANWEPDQPESFLRALRWARAEGARVFSCSIIMPTWSDGEGRGPIHQAMREALGDGTKNTDALFFASAGNTALRHFWGALRPDRDGWHQWARGKKDNAVRPVGKEHVSIELCCSGATAYELVLHDLTAGRDVALSRSKRGEAGGAVVRYQPQFGRRYSVRVRSVAGGPTEKVEAPDRFHLTVLNGKLQYAMRSGSIPFPGDGPEVTAVGAVDESGRRWAYSSCGPNGPAPKPDLVATVPFPSVWRPHLAFGGTSAAAPQAVALAAILWSAQPAWPADKVRQTLLRSAVGSTQGHSVEKGFGLLRLPALGR